MKPLKYLSFFRVGLREGLQYRANAVSGVFATFISLVLFYYVWRAIAASGELAQPFSSIIAYVALAQVINSSTSADIESWVGERVRKGTIVNELKKPASLGLQLYFYQLGKSSFKIVTRGIPAVTAAILVLGIGLPSSGLMFFLSVFLSLNLVILLSYTTSMLVFWTKIGNSLRMIRFMVTALLSGAMIPLYLIPENIVRFFRLTPFPSLVDAPISIYLGSSQGVLSVFAIQLFWIGFLLLFSQVLWKKAKKKLTVQGG
ncbi:MAG: ABC transporter permease [Candidatus Nanohaloarchaea archaeon]